MLKTTLKIPYRVKEKQRFRIKQLNKCLLKLKTCSLISGYVLFFSNYKMAEVEIFNYIYYVVSFAEDLIYRIDVIGYLNRTEFIIKSIGFLEN